MRRKTEAEVREEASPYRPTPYEISDAIAIKALYDGAASPEQQRAALAWIIEKAAATHDQQFRPGGIEGQRNTDFALGKAQVGKEIVKLIKLPKDRLKMRGGNNAN